MDHPPTRTPMAGGALIALGAIGGAAVGFLVGEATPGFLLGAGGGVVLSLLIWVFDRRR